MRFPWNPSSVVSLACRWNTPGETGKPRSGRACPVIPTRQSKAAKQNQLERSGLWTVDRCKDASSEAVHWHSAKQPAMPLGKPRHREDQRMLEQVELGSLFLRPRLANHGKEPSEEEVESLAQKLHMLHARAGQQCSSSALSPRLHSANVTQAREKRHSG